MSSPCDKSVAVVDYSVISDAKRCDLETQDLRVVAQAVDAEGEVSVQAS